jgi:hypothetical protein
MSSNRNAPIAFTMAVSPEDWDPQMQGWRCPALRIPSAEIEAVYVEGLRVDNISYEVLREYEMLRWSHVPQPQRATIAIKLTEALSTQRRTNFWKKVAATAPIIAAIITALFSSALWRIPAGSGEGASFSEPAIFKLSSPVYGECGSVTMYGSAEMPADSSARITRLIWDWGDSSPVEGNFPATHRYSRNEKYPAKIVAYAGNKDVGNRTIIINVNNVIPRCRQ